MFKSGGFEDEIYRSMEKTLVANQVEDKYGFNKLAQATDCLNAAAEIFEQAGMHEEAEEVTKVLQGLATALSGETSSESKFANEAHKRCNCEQAKCKHEPGGCKNKAGDKKAMYIGSICDHCAKLMPAEYMK